MNLILSAFPLEQIGWGLRQLSLSGQVGNVIAIIIYLLMGAIPCILWLVLKRKGKNYKVDYLLFPISGGLLLTLYYMINPALIPTNGVGGGKGLMAVTFYSILIGYLVIRILKMASMADGKGLQKGLRVLLYGIMIIFAYLVGYELLVNLPQAIETVREANDTSLMWEGLMEGNLMVTYIFLVLRSLIGALPYVLDIFLLILSVKAIDKLLADAYSHEAVMAVKRVGTYCKKALSMVVISEVVCNVLQMVFAKSLYQIQITANIPVFSILFVIAILVITRFVEENQKLKQENDLFV